MAMPVLFVVPVPDFPLFGPEVTLNVTNLSGMGKWVLLRTVAVTVWEVPSMFVAVEGANVIPLATTLHGRLSGLNG